MKETALSLGLVFSLWPVMIFKLNSRGGRCIKEAVEQMTALEEDGPRITS
jgi:hypothetical protein